MMRDWSSKAWLRPPVRQSLTDAAVCLGVILLMCLTMLV